MTRIRSRTHPGEAIGPREVRLLDWFGEPDQRTVAYRGTYFQGPRLTSRGEDLFRFAGSVYCADRIASRAAALDRWTRDLSLQYGVSDPGAWRDATPELLAAIRFLSGDNWSLSVRRGRGRLAAVRAMTSQQEIEPFGVVCLFSGGLDSLCGALQLLESGERVALVGHYESGLAPRRQRLLAERLSKLYGSDSLRLYQLYLAPASRRVRQKRPLPAERENTTRARSLLFIAAGLAFADALGADVPLHIPENGFIGINVPLRPTRVGSNSTRTTHPWFLKRLLAGVRALGIANPIENPYSHSTKGEVLARVDARLLAELTPLSLSCAHPESLRWSRESGGHCGYCLPCIIRRAGMHHVGLDDPGQYWKDVLTDDDLLDPWVGRAADPVAVLGSLRETPGPLAVLRNGPVSGDEVDDFRRVHSRGRAELAAWISERGSPRVRAGASP